MKGRADRRKDRRWLQRSTSTSSMLLRAPMQQCSDAVLSSPTSLWVRPLVVECRVRLIPKAGNVIASEEGARGKAAAGVKHF